MIVALAPWLFALGTAVLLEVVGRMDRGRSELSSVADFSRSWSGEPGVVRAYGQRMQDDTLLLVIECTEAPDRVPGEFSGLPVRVKMTHQSVQPGRAEAAARAVARLYPGMVRPVEEQGRLDLVSVSGPVSSLLVAGRVQLDEAARVSTRFGVSFRVVPAGSETLLEFREAP